MPKICRMFIKTDTVANNNKFWEITLEDDDRVLVRNGRVGASPQFHHVGHGEKLLISRANKKMKDGYKEVERVAIPSENKSATKEVLSESVAEQIGQGNQILTDLLNELVAINRHQIVVASGGKMDVDLSTGIVKTPIGVVTTANVNRARMLLGDLQTFVANKDFDAGKFRHDLEEYLMLVPQKVSARAGWHRQIFAAEDSLERQAQFLDQLESSVSVAEERVKEAAKAEGKVIDKPLFRVSMGLNEDGKVHDAVSRFFREGAHQGHASSRLKIRRIFDLTLHDMAEAFAEDGAKMSNIRQLWHGTRAHNLISIFKSGLIIPKEGGSIHIAGRMFGNGVYFSDQSTKSLNYSMGYWDGGPKDSRCFMLLSDVAMGKEWYPSRSARYNESNYKPPAGYDSTFAKAGSLVRNNEMIVYRTSQANITRLIEFSL